MFFQGPLDYVISVCFVLLFLLALILYNVHRKNQRIAKISKREEAKLPQSTDRIEAIPLTKRQRRYQCGHKGPKHFLIHLWGEEKKRRDYTLCPNCLLEKLSSGMIRCPDCLLPILKGDAVALYAVNENENLHPDARVVDEQVVCCLRWLCTPTAAGFVGHWNGTGIDYIRANRNSVAAEAFATGETQYSDLS